MQSQTTRNSAIKLKRVKVLIEDWLKDMLPVDYIEFFRKIFEVYLVYNIKLLSGIQHSDSVFL